MNNLFPEFDVLYNKRKELLRFYSKYNSIREVEQEMLDIIIHKELKAFGIDSSTNIIEILTNNKKHYFLIKKMTWESNYFKRTIYKLETVLFNHDDYKILTLAIISFIEKLNDMNCQYCYADIPAEDNLLIQALGVGSFKLVETRLTYSKNNLQNYESEKYSVRKATIFDLPNLKRVASKMRNNYDRIHSDTFFSNEKADKYLATFAEATLNGFADFVIVPNESGIKPDAFFAANFNKKDCEIYKLKISQFVLAAVDSETCKGWYSKLLSEMCYLLKDSGADYVITITQATNRAVIHTYEKYGFKYGHTSHIFSISL